MNELHGHRAFTHSRSNALIEPWRTSPTAKMPGTFVSSKHGSRSRVHPSGRCPSHEVGSGENKAAFVALHHIAQPIGARLRADKDKHARRALARFVGVGTKNGDFLQLGFAVHLSDAGVCPELNVWRTFDLRRSDTATSCRPSDSRAPASPPLRVFGEVHRRLTRRIRAADDVHGLAFTRNRLRRHRRRNRRPRLESSMPGASNRRHCDSRRQHQGVAGNLASIPQLDDAIRTFRANADASCGEESPRRSAGPAPPRAAPDRRRSGHSEIQDNSQSANSCLPGRRALPVPHHRVQPFRCAIHRGRQPRGPSANNRKIIKVVCARVRNPTFCATSAGTLSKQLCPIWEKTTGRLVGFWPSASSSRFVSDHWRKSPRRSIDTELIARQKIAQLIRTRRPARTQHADSFKRRDGRKPCQSSSRSSNCGYRCSSGGSHGFRKK